MHRASKSYLALLCVLTAVAFGCARAATPGPVTGIYFFEVPPPLSPAFREGLKGFVTCLKGYGAKFTVLTYTELGDRARLAVFEPHRAWAGVDWHEHHSREGKCAEFFRYGILPNFTKWSGEIAQVNPKLSYLEADDNSNPPPMLWVNAYRVKAGQRNEFIESQERVATAAAKVHWNAHFTGYDVYGAGKDGPSFLYLSPTNSYADIGEDVNASAEHMMESVYGKAAAHADSRKFAGSLADEWSDIWTYQSALSYVPAK